MALPENFAQNLLENLDKTQENKPGRPDLQVIPTEGPGSDSVEADDPLTQRQRSTTETYEAMSASMMNRNDFLTPVKERPSPYVDIANIILGTEMNSLGIGLDAEGFDFSWDRMKNQWSEHPIMSTAALASWILPGSLAATQKLFRSRKFAGISDDALKEYGLIETLDDATRISDDVKRKMQAQVYQIQRKKELDNVVAAGVADDASLLEKARYQKSRLEHSFRERFANTYADRLNPNQVAQNEAFVKRIQGYMEGDDFQRHLGSLPDAKYGPAIARSFIDPSELNKLPTDVKRWAVTMRDDLKRFQREAYEEGLISEDQFAQIGEVWFPLLRAGTPLAHQGPMSTLFKAPTKGKKLQAIQVPRTTSPSLLERTTRNEEALSLLRRQEAASHLEEGRTTKALSLLKGAEDEATRGLIQQGRTGSALRELKKETSILADPEHFTVNGLLQQKMLLESFRYIRDIALDPNFVKKASEVKAMGRGSQRGWVSLDSLDNANILRRMVGKKQGLDAVEELGYVRKDLFKALEDMVQESRPGSGMGTLFEALTAMHKTAKTALNPYTHGQNILGNMVFMWQSGFNPLDRNNLQTMKTAFNAYREWGSAHRAGKTIPDLGKLKTVTGRQLNIADELSDPMVKDIILESNLLEAEGIKGLQRIMDKADDSQLFLKTVVGAAQAGAKKGGKFSIEQASKIYMAEDDVAKLGYYLGMRQQGMSRQAALTEVGRRLPIYSHVGPTIREARRIVLPWVSFPAEAMRITKNNLMDHPLRTMMLFHSYKGMQAMAYPFTSESAEGLRGQMANLPTYAQRPGRTIMTPFRDSNNNMRSMSLDWLPHTSFLPPTSAKEAPFLKKIGVFGIDQPHPILTGIMSAFTGKDAWGNDIPLDPQNPAADFGKTMGLSLFGFVAPPLVEKYFARSNQPYPWYKLYQDAGVNVDPSTGKPGDPLFDLFINNFSSFGKMYPASGEQGLANVARYHSEIDRYMARMGKYWDSMTKSGDIEGAVDALRDVEALFVEKWKDPRVAQRKFSDWLIRREKTLRRHPKLRGLTREELINAIMGTVDTNGEARTRAQADRAAAARQEIGIRGHSRGR